MWAKCSCSPLPVLQGRITSKSGSQKLLFFCEVCPTPGQFPGSRLCYVFFFWVGGEGGGKVFRCCCLTFGGWSIIERSGWNVMGGAAAQKMQRFDRIDFISRKIATGNTFQCRPPLPPSNPKKTFQNTPEKSFPFDYRAIWQTLPVGIVAIPGNLSARSASEKKNKSRNPKGGTNTSFFRLPSSRKKNLFSRMHFSIEMEKKTDRGKSNYPL